MNLVFGEDERIARWVHAQIPHMPAGFGEAKALGVVDASLSILGGVVFHEYRGNDIQMSCAAVSRRWLNRQFLFAIFYYPFITLGCERVTSFVPANNKHTRRFLEGLGFIQEGIMRRGFIEDDCAIYGMLRSECKWIGEKNG